MIQILGALAAGAVALGGAGLTAVGNTLFDFALNPRAERSIMARVDAGEVNGIDNDAIRGDPFLAEARGWFEQAKRDVSIQAPDGGELRGWRVLGPGVVPAADGARDAASPDTGHRYMILCHGYSGRPSDLAREAYLAHREGFSVLLPAARGHERNADRYVGMGWLDSKDLLGWIDLVVRFDAQARIVLYGVSMGGAEVMMASGLDLPPQVRCIVEDCGFTSVWDEFELQIQNVMHLPPVPLLNAASAVCRTRAGYGFKEASSLDRLARARVPMLFIHGMEDTFVPFSMLDSVFDACASPVKEKLAVEGAGHGLSSTVAPERYWSTVSSFIGRHL